MQAPYNPYAKPLSPPLPYTPPQKSFWDTIKGRAEELNDYAPHDGTQWSEGEQPYEDSNPFNDVILPCPSMIEETEKQTQGQGMGLIGHSNAIGGDIQSRLGVWNGFKNACYLMAALCVFAAILYGFFIKF